MCDTVIFLFFFDTKLKSNKKKKSQLKFSVFSSPSRKMLKM
jgi:hypothetical protein